MCMLEGNFIEPSGQKKNIPKVQHFLMTSVTHHLNQCSDYMHGVVYFSA